MKKDVADKWVKALRSGKYKKTTGRLRDTTGYCCLGVLCDISKQGSWVETVMRDTVYEFEDTQESEELPPAVQHWAGMKSYMGDFPEEFKGAENLANLNDEVAKSFRMIANFIEKNWEDL